MTRHRLLWEIAAVLLFKAAFFTAIWACCFRQDGASRIAAPPALEEVRHGAER